MCVPFSGAIILQMSVFLPFPTVSFPLWSANLQQQYFWREKKPKLFYFALFKLEENCNDDGVGAFFRHICRGKPPHWTCVFLSTTDLSCNAPRLFLPLFTSSSAAFVFPCPLNN